MPGPDLKLNLEKLSHYKAWSFIPEDADLQDKDTIINLYIHLAERDVGSAEDLEKWILDRSELEAAVDQEGSVLYIKMTCHTDNRQYSENYKNFIENIAPEVKTQEDCLNRKYLELNEKFALDEEKYFIYQRKIKTDINLFRESNVALETQVQLLSQKYQSVCGRMTVDFEGKERTLPEMGKYLYEQDREVRRSAWLATAQRRFSDKDHLDEIFDEMLVLRNKIAQNADLNNFSDFQFQSYHRFDYSHNDCKQYHKVAELLLVPIVKKILCRRKEQMGLDVLRPWDIHADPLGRPPLRPFEKVDDFIAGVKKIFSSVDKDLGCQFAEMDNLGLLDLASRKGKAPGGYQSALADARKPFIFMNAVGVDDDVRTLLHEGGHSFHTFACVSENVYDYRHAPMEFCEVASMSMELLGEAYLGVFYTEEEKQRSRINHLESVIQVLVWVATIDAFQYWIYENPGHSRDQRDQAWLEMHNRFGGNLMDWSGLEGFHKSLWHRQLHIFEVPFYYIEYGIAQLGALQIWLNAKKDFEGTITAYRKGLSLGGSRSLPELFSSAGIKFDFSEEAIAPLVDVVVQELAL